MLFLAERQWHRLVHLPFRNVCTFFFIGRGSEECHWKREERAHDTTSLAGRRSERRAQPMTKNKRMFRDEIAGGEHTAWSCPDRKQGIGWVRWSTRRGSKNQRFRPNRAKAERGTQKDKQWAFSKRARLSAVKDNCVAALAALIQQGSVSKVSKGGKDLVKDVRRRKRLLRLMMDVNILAWCSNENWEMSRGCQKYQRRHSEGDGAVHSEK